MAFTNESDTFPLVHITCKLAKALSTSSFVVSGELIKVEDDIVSIIRIMISL